MAGALNPGRHFKPPVCSENFIRIDWLKESPKVHNVCTALLRPGGLGLGIQVDEPA
jgi:hypothetical protein